MNRVNYAEDCIHLHACRRMQLVAKSKGFTYSRGCDKETCTAYVPGADEKYVDAEEANRRIRRAYAYNELWCFRDEAKTLNEIIEHLEEVEE